MLTESFKAAVVQMSSQTNIDDNLDQAYSLIKEAADNNALVAGLPENFAFLGGLSMRMKKAEEIAEKVPRFLSATANEFSLFLMGGSYPVPAPDHKVYNHSVLYGPEGNELISYNKIHLFDVSLGEEEKYRESNYVVPGDLTPAVHKDETIGNWGLSICYDLRFPELYKALTDQGAEIISVPSAFTFTTGQDHWEPLLKARAIETTSYVFAPAQTGVHGKNRNTWGHSMIVDPWGEVVADAGREPGVAYAEINPQRIKAVRKMVPSLQHHRL